MRDIDRRALCSIALAAGAMASPSLAAVVGSPAQRNDLNIEEQLILAHCRDVAVRASMFMDANEVEPMLSLFTDDLQFVKPSTYPVVSIRGHEQFRSVLARRGPNFISRHLFTNSIADRIDVNSVRVRSYFTHFSGTRPEGPETALPMAEALKSVGEYDDIIVRRAGAWLIARRVGRFSFGGV